MSQLPKAGDPEYGYRCPRCGAAVTMLNVRVVECVSPFCDWISA